MDEYSVGPVEGVSSTSAQLLWREPRRVEREEASATRSPSVPERPELPAILEQHLQVRDARLSFRKDEGSGKWIAQIVDVQTGEVLRQVPPEVMRKVAAALRDGDGLLIDRLR